MKDNKLIAEFMDMQDYQEMGKYITPPFHASWDWLMPVVEKCLTTDGHYSCLSPVLNDALLTCNIEEVYKAVVEFIKEKK